MQQLTNAEEQVMQHLWQLEKAFMKDLLEAYPEPKPATTTIATLLKRMIDKQFVAYKEYGNSREYYPLIDKNDYFSKHVNGLISNFFNNSASLYRYELVIQVWRDILIIHVCRIIPVTICCNVFYRLTITDLSKSLDGEFSLHQRRLCNSSK